MFYNTKKEGNKMVRKEDLEIGTKVKNLKSNNIGEVSNIYPGDPFVLVKAKNQSGKSYNRDWRLENIEICE